MTGVPDSVAVVDGVDLDAVAVAVRACPAVDDLFSEPGRDSITTYLPGRRISGLRVDALAVTVAVRGLWGVPAREIASQIRAAASPYAAGRRVDVVLADLTPAPGYEPEPEPEPHPEPAPLAVLDPEPPSIVEPVLDPEAETVLVRHTVTVESTVVTDALPEPQPDPTPWVTRNSADDGVPSSAPITPIAGATPPPS